jgi:hypothetical protein
MFNRRRSPVFPGILLPAGLPVNSISALSDIGRSVGTSWNALHGLPRCRAASCVSRRAIPLASPPARR